MSSQETTTDSSWVPQACTLPTAEQPLRLAEFDQFFRDVARAVDRPSPQHLRLQLVGAAQVEETARQLTARESSCCSFFTFDLFRSGAEALTLDIRVPPAHVDVLDNLASHAASAAGIR